METGEGGGEGGGGDGGGGVISSSGGNASHSSDSGGSVSTVGIYVGSASSGELESRRLLCLRFDRRDGDDEDAS